MLLTEVAQICFLTLLDSLCFKTFFLFTMPFPICGFRTLPWQELPMGIDHI